MKTGIITSLLALTFTGMNAQQQPVLPQLVVTLTVDQLRTDYLENFAPLYGNQGFKRLMSEGRYYRDAAFSFEGVDRASAMAALFTGSTPSMNGIIAENWLDVGTLRPVNCVDDPKFMGNYTDESSSPASLLTSTVGDELKIATRNKALVYAVSPFREAAILSAGHAGNGAFWLNEANGKWCSSTYYSEFPWWLSQYNDRHSPDLRIRDMVWTPIHPMARYKYLPEWRTQPFKHRLDGDRTNRFRHLLTTPYVNDEVNMLVDELLKKSTIGRDSVPDLLALTYYAGNFQHRSTQECAMEMQDAYARLDRSVAELLRLLDKQIGLKNILFCLTSTGYTEPEAPDAGLYRIPGGEFHMNRCTTLLNMYLMATYGEGQYVEGYYNNQIYLNHKLIEKKQLSLTDLQDKSADFLSQFSGVREVYSAHRLLLGSWSPQIEKARNAFHHQRSGDIQINILPGWTMVKESNTDHRVVRTAYTPAPLFMMGAGFKAATIDTPVSSECLAPTLTNAIHIRAPNAAAKDALH